MSAKVATALGGDSRNVLDEVLLLSIAFMFSVAIILNIIVCVNGFGHTKLNKNV